MPARSKKQQMAAGAAPQTCAAILAGIAASRRHCGLSCDYRDLGWLFHMSWKVDLSEAREIAKAWAAARRPGQTNQRSDYHRGATHEERISFSRAA
jgi:hypothetical protein